MIDVGLLVLRLVVGYGLFGHGTQKLFGWFGGRGMVGARETVGRRGFRPITLWAYLAAFSETTGGLLIALGLLHPLGPAAAIAAMTVVCLTGWQGRLWQTHQGTELATSYLAASVALALTGPGIYAADRAVGLALPGEIAAIAFGLVAIGVLAAMVSRGPVPAAAPPRG